MSRPVAAARPTHPMLGDATIAAGAWLAASAGVVLGGPTLWVALVALAIPMLAFVAVGHLAGRGAVMACVASALGAATASGATGVDAWAAAGLIGLVDLVALIGGAAADRMAPLAVPSVEPSAGTWMSVTVHHEARASESPQPVPVLVSRTGPMDRSRRHARPVSRPARIERTA